MSKQETGSGLHRKVCREKRITLIEFNIIGNLTLCIFCAYQGSPFRALFHDKLIDDPLNDKSDFILLRSVYETPETTSFARRN
jgi:hypothetical protein